MRIIQRPRSVLPGILTKQLTVVLVYRSGSKPLKCGDTCAYSSLDFLERSRRSSISPEFVDCPVLHNGKTPVSSKWVNNLGSLLLHGNEDLREQIFDREERGQRQAL